MSMNQHDFAFVVLEDDDLFADWIEYELSNEFGDRTKVTSIQTESEFWESIEEYSATPPDAFILDVRVRWTYPGSNASQPEVAKQDPRVAGIRCHDALKTRLPKTPCILFTVLDTDDLKKKVGNRVANFLHVSKTEGMQEVIKLLHRHLEIKRL